jgi:hypothetical protein
VYIMSDDPERDKAYPLGKYPAVNQDAILLRRAVAIEGYAVIERALSMLFAHWLGTTIDVAGLVFFRINAGTRNRILDDLKKTKLQNQHNLFWNSLLGLVKTIDQQRNEIVHWHVVNNIDLSLPHEQASRWTLKPPTGWTNPLSGSLDENDLSAFAQKCEFISRLITMFVMSFDRTLELTWQDIFAQPVSYPRPDTHPLSPKYVKTPSQSSGA